MQINKQRSEDDPVKFYSTYFYQYGLSNPQITNPYVYVANNPTTWVDPSGLFVIPGAIGGGIVGGIAGAISGGISGWGSGGWQGAIGGAIGGGAVGFGTGFIAGGITGTLGGGIAGSIAGNAFGLVAGTMLSPDTIGPEPPPSKCPVY